MPSGNFVKAMVIIGLLAPPSAAVAIDNGQYSQVPQEIRDWFKSVRSKNGIACCDISDGHRTDYQMRETEYWVPIDGDWILSKTGRQTWPPSVDFQTPPEAAPAK